MPTLAAHILQELRRAFGVSLGETVYRDSATGAQVWLLTAYDARHFWMVRHDESYYAAVCELARLIGMDLEA